MCNVQHVARLSNNTDTSMSICTAGSATAKSVADISNVPDVTGSLEQLSFPPALDALVVRDRSVCDVALVSRKNKEYRRRARVASEKNSCEPESSAQIAGKEIEPIVAEILGADFKRSPSRGLLFSQLGIWPHASSLLCRESDGSFPSGENPKVPAAILECKLRSKLHDWEDITQKFTQVLGITANTAPAIRGVLALVMPERNMPYIEDTISLQAFNERGSEFEHSIRQNAITTVLISVEEILSYAESSGAPLSRKTKNQLDRICRRAALARH